MEVIMTWERVVLIVDEEDLLEQIASPLKKDGGYRILKASNEEDAFNLILDDFVDFLITDLSLTYDNGLELLNKVAELPPDDRPIVYVLSPENTLSAAEVKKYGIHKVIKTPCQFNFLLEELGHSIQKIAA